MRLINADALKRAFCNHCDGEQPCTEPCVDIGLIETAPTIDAVPVRCKDCKWFKSGIDIDGKPFTKCIGANGSVRTYGHTAPDWFCADGERKDGEHDV